MEIQVLTPEGIVGIDNAVELEDLDYIEDLIYWAIKHDIQLNRAMEDDSSMTEENHPYDFWAIKNFSLDLYPKIFTKFVENINIKVREIFLDYLEFLGIDRSIETNLKTVNLEALTVHRASDEESLGDHVDCFDYGLVLYVNDPSDYEGGLFQVTETGQTLTPVKNRLLIVPSNIMHRVTHTTKGVRMVLTSFVAIGEGSQTRET